MYYGKGIRYTHFALSFKVKMADNFVAACEQAVEALLSFQNVTRDNVQRLAATFTPTTANNYQPENQTTTIRLELSRRFPSYRPGRLLRSNASTCASSIPRMLLIVL